MKAFVAGATGVVGTRTVTMLLAAGHQVTGLARPAQKADLLARQGGRAVQASLFDPDALGRAVAGHDAVVNLATHIPAGAAAIRAKAWRDDDKIRTEDSHRPGSPVHRRRRIRGGTALRPALRPAPGQRRDARPGTGRQAGRPGQARRLAVTAVSDDAAAAVAAALSCAPGIYNVAEPPMASRTSTTGGTNAGKPGGRQMNATDYSRTGQGEPLVLLHWLGSSRSAWDPVIPALAQRFDVIAVDLPGFGTSPPLPAGVEPSPAELAADVAGLLDDLGIDRPHLAGNSLGGWVAMELAKIRPVRSVTLLSPAGLWRHGAPLYCMVSLRLSRWLAKNAGPALSRIVATGPGRAVLLGQGLAHPARLPAAQARSVVQALGTCPGFEATLKATAHRRLRGAQQITAPVTVAFGSRDFVLLKHQSRNLGELPPGTRSAALPGCGHMPMSDDPAGVADLIITSTSRAPVAPARTTLAGE